MDVVEFTIPEYHPAKYVWIDGDKLICRRLARAEFTNRSAGEPNTMRSRRLLRCVHPRGRLGGHVTLRQHGGKYPRTLIHQWDRLRSYVDADVIRSP